MRVKSKMLALQKILLTLLLSFFCLQCKKPKENSFFPRFEKLDVKLLNWVEIEPESLDSLGPLKNRSLVEYRPEKAYRLSYLNNNRDSVWAWVISFPQEYLAYGFYKRFEPFTLASKNYYLSNNWVISHSDKFLCLFKKEDEGVWTLPEWEDFLPWVKEDYLKPAIFFSFPLSGRVENSEFVVPRWFLGREKLGETVGASFKCYGKTGVLFRSFSWDAQKQFEELKNGFRIFQKSEFGDFKQFWGETEYGEPLLLRTNRWGYLGFLGCFDKNIAEEWVEKASQMDALVP